MSSIRPGIDVAAGQDFSLLRGAKVGILANKAFHVVGAPYIDSRRWIDSTLDQGITKDGFNLETVEFTPRFQKHASTLCQGIQIKITDRKTFKPYRFGITLL
tara:strand:- start:48 stop:353 length:306 start_codon:yes stop_codon:yes gene_type:complete